MIWYVLKRLLWFIPTLFVLSLLAFGLSKWAPGDPVSAYYEAGSGLHVSADIDVRKQEALYAETAGKFGLDRPVFYLKVQPAAYPDTLYRILFRDRRSALRQLVARYGNWPVIQAYYRDVYALYLRGGAMPDSLRAQLFPLLRRLLTASDPGQIGRRITQMQSVVQAPAFQAWTDAVDSIAAAWQLVERKPKRYLLYIPRLAWQGWDNQYQHWASRFLRGDFGLSLIDGRPVQDKIRDALRWTLLLNGAALILAFGLAIPLGVYSARYRGLRTDRTIALLLFFLYSLPSFWIATLCLVFFTSPEYGMDWFPTLGPNNFRELGDDFSSRLAGLAWHFTLPVFCLTYGALAIIARQLRGSMVEALRQDFIRTARAKGLSENRVLWHHAFRHALFPLITLSAGILPAMLAGSVVIEYIFNIYGMGTLTVQSIVAKDWPVVYTVLIITALLTMLGMLLADLLYAWADPRVKYEDS